jgi:hypothetical protein
MHAWDNMTRRFRRRKIITGWARTFETTRSKTYGDAHPHFHILMQVPPEYFDRKSEIYMGYKKDDLIKMWRECMGVDYDPSISIEGVKDYAMAGAVMETTKYLAKGSDLAGLPDEDFAHYVNAIHGVRAWSCGGRLKISDEEIERAFTHDESDEDHAGVCGNCGGKLHEMREVWDKTTQIYRMTVELDFKRLNQSETSEKKENHEGKSFQTIYNIHIDGDAFFGSGLDARRGTGD